MSSSIDDKNKRYKKPVNPKTATWLRQRAAWLGVIAEEDLKRWQAEQETEPLFNEEWKNE